MAKTLKQVLELYKPKAGDEQKFVAKHVVVKHDDANGNKDDVFQATNVKTVEREKNKHGYPPGADESVYEEVEQVEEAAQDDGGILDVKSTYLKIATNHAKQANAKGVSSYARMHHTKMCTKAIEASKMDDHTKAFHHYTGINMKEEVEIDYDMISELSDKTLKSYVKTAASQANQRYMANLLGKPAPKGIKDKDRRKGTQRAAEKMKEEVELGEEQLDELSSDTLRRYMKGARKDITKNTANLGDAPAGSKRLARINKRVKGFRTAWAKADAKESVELGEEQLDELSSDTLRRYMKGARKDITKNTAHLGDAPAGSKRLARINKRVKGYRTAWAKVDAKEGVELDDTTKLLELYVNLNDENKVSFVEMFDNDKELLMSFVNGNVESEGNNV